MKRTTIDRLGRVVVPKGLREKLGLAGGAAVDVGERDGVIEIRPVSADLESVETPEGPVAARRGDLAPLTDSLVREALEQNRR